VHESIVDQVRREHRVDSQLVDEYSSHFVQEVLANTSVNLDNTPTSGRTLEPP
jgi:hypothetical protein